MTDDPKPRRARTHVGDTGRAEVGREYRRASAYEWPEPIDPELTPPPMAPPQPEDFEQMDQAEQLRALRGHADTNARAIEAVWPARHFEDRLTRIERDIHGWSKQITSHQASLDQFVMPAVKSLMGRCDMLITQNERTGAKLDSFFETEWPSVRKTIEALAVGHRDQIDRLGRVEVKQDRAAEAATGHSERIRIVENGLADTTSRVVALERVNADAKLARKAGDERQSKLFTWARAGFAAAVIAVSFVASHLGTIAAWLRK